MKTIPDHLKAKTKLICDTLKCRDHFFIKSNYEIIDGGSTNSRIQRIRSDHRFIDKKCEHNFKMLEQSNRSKI